METIELKKLNSLTGKIAVNIRSGYNYLTYNSNPNNCKLCTLDRVGTWLNSEHIEGFKKVIELSRKLIFNVSLTDEHQVKYLQEHFQLVNIAKIPVGYGSGFQYHCCFLTNNTSYMGYDNYKRRILAKEADKPKSIVTEVKSVDTILEHLQKITAEDLEKIKSYKQPKRAKDLLSSLINK